MGYDNIMNNDKLIEEYNESNIINLELQSQNESEKVKKIRKFSSKDFKCFINGCYKAYVNESALNLHLKLKHSNVDMINKFSINNPGEDSNNDNSIADNEGIDSIEDKTNSFISKKSGDNSIDYNSNNISDFEKNKNINEMSSFDNIENENISIKKNSWNFEELDHMDFYEHIDSLGNKNSNKSIENQDNSSNKNIDKSIENQDNSSNKNSNKSTEINNTNSNKNSNKSTEINNTNSNKSTEFKIKLPNKIKNLAIENNITKNN